MRKFLKLIYNSIQKWIQGEQRDRRAQAGVPLQVDRDRGHEHRQDLAHPAIRARCH